MMSQIPRKQSIRIEMTGWFNASAVANEWVAMGASSDVG